jgi:hypothetical protein
VRKIEETLYHLTTQQKMTCRSLGVNLLSREGNSQTGQRTNCGWNPVWLEVVNGGKDQSRLLHQIKTDPFLAAN